MSFYFLSAPEVEKLQKYLRSKPRILILPHAYPDGDALGSALAIHWAFSQEGFHTKIACKTPIAEEFQYLTKNTEILSDFFPEEYDAVFFLDCGDKVMTQFHKEHPEILSDKMVKINIDHHPSNDLFGEINFVNTKSASSSMITFELLETLKMDITPRIATALLTGIYTDTGAFMHQNTSPEAYLFASKLVKKGGNPRTISKHVFRHYKFRTLKLWSRILENLYITKEGAAIVGVSQKDYESLGCTREDLNGVIDFINAMPEAEYSVLLSEDGKGNVKASLRTRKEGVDLKALAEQFGGGGHVKASGFTIPQGHIEKEVKWKIVTKPQECKELEDEK